MKIFFDSENAVRNGSLRLGLKPPVKASPGQEEILHIWALRPPSTGDGRTNSYTHPEVQRFAPERPNTTVAPPPKRFGGKNYSGGDAKRSRRNAAVGMIESWGASNADMRSVKLLGEGVSGSVYEVPSHVARLAPLKTSYIVMRRGIPRGGSVAVKFQTVRDMRDLRDAIRETQTHAIASTDPSPASGGRPSDIPSLTGFVPSLYAAWYDASTRLFVTFMDTVSGEPLGDIIEGRLLRPSELTQLKRAFAALWSRGIFHADAHGDNVFIDPSASPPRVSIIDFGQSVFLPPEIRPASMAIAMSAGYTGALESYVSKRKAGKAWFNPNTRTLQIATVRSNTPAVGVASNAKTTAGDALNAAYPNAAKANASRTSVNNMRIENVDRASRNVLANAIASRAAKGTSAVRNSSRNMNASDPFLPSRPANKTKVSNANITAAIGRSVTMLPGGGVVASNGSRTVVTTNAPDRKRKPTGQTSRNGKRARINPTESVEKAYSKMMSSVFKSNYPSRLRN
jgi:serine/threonine protein kinase